MSEEAYAVRGESERWEDFTCLSVCARTHALTCDDWTYEKQHTVVDAIIPAYKLYQWLCLILCLSFCLFKALLWLDLLFSSLDLISCLSVAGRWFVVLSILRHLYVAFSFIATSWSFLYLSLYLVSLHYLAQSNDHRLYTCILSSSRYGITVYSVHPTVCPHVSSRCNLLIHFGTPFFWCLPSFRGTK